MRGHGSHDARDVIVLDRLFGLDCPSENVAVDQLRRCTVRCCEIAVRGRRPHVLSVSGRSCSADVSNASCLEACGAVSIVIAG